INVPEIGSFYEFAEVKPRGNFFSFLRDSWFQDKPSTPRVPRWCSRLAGHGEAGTPAVLACRWPGPSSSSRARAGGFGVRAAHSGRHYLLSVLIILHDQ